MCVLENEKMNSPDAQKGCFQGDQAVNEGFSVPENLLQNQSGSSLKPVFNISPHASSLSPRHTDTGPLGSGITWTRDGAQLPP